MPYHRELSFDGREPQPKRPKRGEGKCVSCKVDDPLLPPTVELIVERGMIRRRGDIRGGPLEGATDDCADFEKDHPLIKRGGVRYLFCNAWVPQVCAHKKCVPTVR